MNMIERVARAICKASGHDPDGPTSDVYIEGDPVAGIPWAGYRKEARSAIEAMRGPTDAMTDAGGEYMARLFDAPRDARGHFSMNANTLHEIMISAALNEKEEGKQ